MKKLKTTLVIGFVFVSILGTLTHFMYQWTGNNPFVGFFTPVNESTWEHMKLLFFPALLYLPIASHFLKKDHPHITNALAYGLLAGTLFIPIFFYTYSGILGFEIMALDIASFYTAVAITYFVTYKLAEKNMVLGNVGFILLIIFTFSFIIFSYNPPFLGIFKEPSAK